jgi:hypothetical protein
MPAPGPGGVQSSLAGLVSRMTAPFRRQPGRGAPVYSYSVGGGSAAAASGNVDITQFSGVFQPSGGMFAPGYPLVPVESEALRIRDFPVGYNYIYTPRSTEPIGYFELRQLAQSHDITRLCIETRKDQIEALDWTIKPRDEKNPQNMAEERADTLTEFWQRPDGSRDFATWLRDSIEDVLVLDAPAFEVRRNRGGAVIGIDVLDGSTIKVLIDDTGRRPAPPAPAFEQIIHGRPWVLAEDGRVSTNTRGKPLFAQQIIYMPRNQRPHKIYGFSPVEQIMLTINTGIRRQLMQLQHFTDSNVPALGSAVLGEGHQGRLLNHQRQRRKDRGQVGLPRSVPAAALFGAGRQLLRMEEDRSGQATLCDLAGLWETWRSPAGESVRSFTIITTMPNALCAELHDRMPVVLKRDVWPVWFDEQLTDVPRLRPCSGPYPADDMICWPISPRVGNVKNNDASLLVRSRLAGSGSRRK